MSAALERLRSQVEAHRRVSAQLADAERWRDDAILEARRAGMSLRAIAAETGLSHQRVAQIVAR